MNAGLFVLVAFAGGAGAGVRFVVDGAIRSRMRSTFPWATTIVNVSGSLALGLITGMMVSHLMPNDLGLVVGVGFLGGYTTFSAASYETVVLIRQRRYAASLVSGLLMLALCMAAAGLGIWMGSAI